MFRPNKSTTSRRKLASADSRVIDPKGSDIIIPIIGGTGFGKSTIINDIVGGSVMTVGHGLQPCTNSVQHVVVPHPDIGDNRRIILVDTPGIVEDPAADSLIDEAQILGRIDRWAKHSYGEGKRITGIVYLYDVTQPRALTTYGQPSDNTGMFKKLCGEDWFHRIILGTTKWDDIQVTSEVERSREEELRRTYWNGMGPAVIKIHSSSSSAREIVNHILEISEKVPEVKPAVHKAMEPKATEPKSHLKIFRRLAVHRARESPDDFKVLDPHEDDIVIAVVGPIGVGKSSIINAIAKRTVMTVRHDLQQHITPSSIQYVAVPHPNDSNRQMILVDTPGFDRTYEYAEILRRIGNWLESSYGKGMKLSGIICLHDISQRCLSQPSYGNLTAFEQLCGDDALANVILGTTMWGQVTPEIGQDRERQLANGHWKEMILRGSTMMQVQSDDSARKIIDRILDNIDFDLVQDELIEIQKLVPDTEAGSILRNTLAELLKLQKELVLQLAKEMEAMRGGETYQERLGDIRKRIGETMAQIAELKVPLGPRIKTFFGVDLPKRRACESEEEVWTTREDESLQKSWSESQEHIVSTPGPVPEQLMLFSGQKVEADPLTDNASDMQDERRDIITHSADCASSRSTLLGPSEHQENKPPPTETEVDREDAGRVNQKSSDGRDSTHSTCSEVEDTETPSLSASSLSLSPKISRPITRGKLEGKMAKDSRNIMDVLGPKESDIVIPIMGPTGVGKSSFINRIAGRDVAIVGHDLRSCTSAIQHVVVHDPSDDSQRIILVDTPGFDDTYVDDAEILRRIALWLACSYGEGMKLAGIVYLHDICQSRMTGTSAKNLEMFTKLCGSDALANVVLGTTKWSDVKQEAGERREEQLRNSFWKDMIKQGSVMSRVLDSSAWDILGRILQNNGVDFVLIQDELVEQQLPIPETAAGRMLRYTQEQFETMNRKTEMVRRMEEDAGDQGR